MTGSRRDRGVSETVAFVLVFSLIVTSVGLVTTAGVDSIRDVQESQQAESSVILMRAVGAGINDVATGARPRYRSSLSLAGGSIRVINETTVTIEVTNATGMPFVASYRPQALSYANDDRNVTYQSGLLARGGERREAVLLVGSGLQCDPGRGYAAISIVRLQPNGSAALGGGSATIDASERRLGPSMNQSGVEFPASRPHPNVTNVTITVDGPYEAAWRDALTDRGFRSAGGSFYCPTERVIVNAPVVEVRLS